MTRLDEGLPKRQRAEANGSPLTLLMPESGGITGDYRWIEGQLATPTGEVPIVSTKLAAADRIGSFKARWGIGRLKYSVPPGLYAVGRPDENSPVFVTANYKMSFDRLRSSLSGLDAWLLVLNTRGINVWCAAGKGTFGTDELIGSVFSNRLSNLVKHRRLIVPQLGAPGITAHKVKDVTGFRIVYGPVRAPDIRAFLAAGLKATPEMRRVRFSLKDRLVLIPYELVHGMKWAILAAVGLCILSGWWRSSYSLDRIVHLGVESAMLALGAFLSAVLLPPLLLPWLPGRSFAARGLAVGLLLDLLLVVLKTFGGGVLQTGWIGLIGWMLMIPAVVSFMATNFTGCSTFTSLSGVEREMRRWLPFQIWGAAIGLVIWLTGRLVQI